MTESETPDGLPQARVTPGRRTRISVVWVIPILAAVVAIGIAVNRILSEGPTITIEFASAEGLEAGKTFIKYKDVKIGQVTDVELTNDYSKVRVTAKMTKSAGDLMVEDAKFWVVKPQVTLSGVSGLGTLLSGNYIGFEAGKSRKQHHKFVGLEVAPIVSIDQPGRQFLLQAESLGSVGVGAPVYYRHIQAGQVIAYDLAPDGKTIQLKAFVNAPYDQYVTKETRFWNASGINVSLGSTGLDVETESLVSILVGGIAFETPAYSKADQPAEANHDFRLFPDRAKAMKQPEALARRYILYFDESLQGLEAGAPVTLLGLPAGQVVDVGLELNSLNSRPRGRVDIVFYPERIISRLQGSQVASAEATVRSEEARRAYLKRLVEVEGLRAQLRSSNLLTGQRYVALDFFPGQKAAAVDWTQAAPVMPTMPSTLPEAQARLEGILAKLDRIPYQAIGEELKTTLETTNKLLAHFDTELTPELKATLDDLRKAIAKADVLMQNTDSTLLAPDAPGQQALQEALQEIAGAARALRDLTDYLERHPDALLKGKDEEKP
jgi:paraquat-inducible protein B